MADENKVGVKYVGSGGYASSITEYNDGSAQVENGDEFQVPEDLANVLILSIDWERSDGKSVADIYELTDEERAAEEAARNREPVLSDEESPVDTNADEEVVASEEEAQEEAKREEGESRVDAKGRSGQNADRQEQEEEVNE